MKQSPHASRLASVEPERRYLLLALAALALASLLLAIPLHSWYWLPVTVQTSALPIVAWLSLRSKWAAGPAAAHTRQPKRSGFSSVGTTDRSLAVYCLEQARKMSPSRRDGLISLGPMRPHSAY